MPNRSKSAAATALAISLGLALSACGGETPTNRTLYSVNQPVVERSNFTLDLATYGDSLSIPEQQRLADWFDTLELGYGDRIALDGATVSEGVRSDVAEIAGRHGVLLSEGAPVTEGYVDPGKVRVVVTRSTAHVPGCDGWSNNSTLYYDNRTTEDYGCAVNSNLAAMIADPEHLLHGAEGNGETVVMSSTKAIESYRSQKPTGAGGLKSSSSSSSGSGGN